MPWDRSRPRNKKYDAGHNKLRAEQMAELRRNGSGTCAEVVCVYASRLITPGMDLHLCHDRTGRYVLGLGHAACNVRAAAREARARRDATRITW